MRLCFKDCHNPHQRYYYSKTATNHFWGHLLEGEMLWTGAQPNGLGEFWREARMSWFESICCHMWTILSCAIRLHLYSTNTLTLKYRQMHTYHFPALFHQAVGGQDVDLLPCPVHVFVAVDNGPYTLHRLASTLPNPAIYLKHSVHTNAKLTCQNIAQWSFFHYKL